MNEGLSHGAAKELKLTLGRGHCRRRRFHACRIGPISSPRGCHFPDPAPSPFPWACGFTQKRAAVRQALDQWASRRQFGQGRVWSEVIGYPEYRGLAFAQVNGSLAGPKKISRSV